MQNIKVGKTLIAGVLCLTPLAVLVTGCGGGDGNSPLKTRPNSTAIPTTGPTTEPTTDPTTGGLTVAQLVGTYRQTSLASPTGEKVNCPGALTSIDESCGANDTATIAATGANSGTVRIVDAENPQGAVGTFTLSGNTLSVSFGTQREVFAVSLLGNTLTLRETSYRDTPTSPEDTDGVITVLSRVS